jgi:SAM-dependent methyltransferase
MTNPLLSLLVDRRWRWLIGYTRFLWYRSTRRLRTCEAALARPKTVSHNLTAFEHVGNDFLMPRMSRLIHAMIATEELNAESSILVIGPRTENDLLILYGNGFRNVTGLDLISYSPWICVGDMHQIPFSDNTFDAVLCGWTISYSTAPEIACNEFVRVLRNGGVVAIGLEHVPSTGNHVSNPDPRLIDPEPLASRINTSDQIVRLFNGSLKSVYVNVDAPFGDLAPPELHRKTGLASSQVIVVGAITKG